MRFALILSAALLAPGGALLAQSGFVAGTTPDRRPVGAARCERGGRDAAWWARCGRGISQPLPPNLGGQDQGAWYTPFNRPGMLPPYDLRGWHVAAPGPR